MSLAPGSRLGRYEVRQLLGAGGMGEVYLAWDSDLEREVAVKTLRGGNESAERARRFEQEAKAASGLHHPNVAHVYEIGSHDDLRFIAMELVPGETLRKRLLSGPMPIDQVLEIATQVAAGLAAAHKEGIVHRDVKPENVIITPDGYAKVLDFGLAKLHESRGEHAATLLMTTPGVAMGTLHYMAPEQVVGGDITPAADVFSLGVVLYEMVTGNRPFEGPSSTDVVSSILSRSPRPIREQRADVPPRLEALISRALAKNVDQRFGDAAEVQNELRAISRESMSFHYMQTRRPSRSVVPIAVALLVIAIIAGGWWMFARSKRRAEALGHIDRAERLLKERKLAEAFEAATAATGMGVDDERARDVIARTSHRLTIESDPPGATAFLQRFKGPATRTRVGVTPLTIPRVAMADYLLTLEKAGYAPAVRPISMTPLYISSEATPLEMEAIRVKLIEAAKLPAGMVFVPGGMYRLSGHQRPSDREITLSDFFIDRLEVSNREFEEFVRDGGYRRRELWKAPFADGGRNLSFEEAMTRFRDTTGVPGPRGWSGGAPPAGREHHPVTGVSWYEAAAYAEWRGKKLPTVYQWEKAARTPATQSIAHTFPWGFVGEGTDPTERSNFNGEGTMPADSLPFGASPFGALHMAGNVSEWCRNVLPPGYAARGGSWRDAVYAFGQTAGYPSFYSAPTLGFRCVSGGDGDDGGFTLQPSGFVPSYKAVDDRTFEEFRKLYEYKKDALNAKVVEVVETPDWRREKIIYVVNGKQVPAYLYLPKGFRRPLQVIQFAPAGDVTSGWRTLPRSIEVQLAPLIRGGRAIISVELEGFLGRPRPPGWVRPDRLRNEYVDYTIERVTEMRRALDYIETRADLDATRIAFLASSAGGGTGVFVTALETRYRSIALSGTGIAQIEEKFVAPANRIHFVPRIKGPKLMIQGRYDEDTTLRSEAEPMFRMLPEPKRLIIFEGGHVPPQELFIPEVTKWLDETMGKVVE